MPPFAIARVPEMVESVVVATHCGMPSRYARTKPGVPAEVVARLPALLPKRMAPELMVAQPVPPLATGRMPVTSLVRETEAQVATPAPFRERTNWLVQEVPAYSATVPPASVTGMAEVMPERMVVPVTVRLVEVAFPAERREVLRRPLVVALVDWSVAAKSVVEVALVVVADVARRLVMRPLVAERAVAKSEVEVALDVVAFCAVKFCRVVEAKVMRPPQNWDAAVVEVATR